MRDNFGFMFANPQPEDKQMNAVRNENLGAIHVSSNVYYGYQPLSREWQKGQSFEPMDIQIINRSGIDFTDANLEERLCRAINQRKRPFSDDALLPSTVFKKRRESEEHELSPPNKCVNLRQPTHNVPDVPRTLMGHYI